MNVNYVKCVDCKKILDPETEALFYNELSYCQDCYEDIITEKQNEELE